MQQRHIFFVCTAVFGISLALYLPAANFDFVNYDDDRYVVSNPYVNTGVSWRNTVWAFTRSHSGNWHPLTWISHQLDCSLYGLNAGGHHLTNVIFHGLNAALLFIVLFRMTGAPWRCAVVSALFAVHPQHVESVAWISERKDVLSTFFLLSALLAYIRFVRTPSFVWSASVAGLFAMGLMAKPMVVTLPFLLLLLDIWPLNRMTATATRSQLSVARSLVIEKLPLFALAVLSCIVTFIVQKKWGAVGTIEFYPIDIRLGNAVVACGTYLLKTVWPTGLAIPYPFPGSLSIRDVILIAAGLLTATMISLRLVRKHPWLLVGWLWFLGTLVPVIGIVQVGEQARADRYTYVPLIGIFIISVWAVGAWVERLRVKREYLVVFASIILVVFAALSARQIQFWRNSRSLFAHTLSATRGNLTAQLNYGIALLGEGQYDSAVHHFRLAEEIFPHSALVPYNIGLIKAKRDSVDAAVPFFEAALARAPNYAHAMHCLGEAYESQGKDSLAMVMYGRCMAADADYWAAFARAGGVLARSGHPDSALLRFGQALQLNPSRWEVHAGMASVLALQNKYKAAVQSYSRAIELNPHSWQLFTDLGRSFLRSGNKRLAVTAFSGAIGIDSTQSLPFFLRAEAYRAIGLMDSTVADTRSALMRQAVLPQTKRIGESAAPQNP